MFEFLKKILHKPNPALPDVLQSVPFRELDDIDGAVEDMQAYGFALVIVRADAEPPWQRRNYSGPRFNYDIYDDAGGYL